MRYTTAEKFEIIRLVEQADVSVNLESHPGCRAGTSGSDCLGTSGVVAS